MTIVKVKRDLSKLSDPNLASRNNQIITNLTTYFATAPALPALIAAHEDFVAKLAASMNGGSIEAALKNEARTGVLGQHDIMIPYIEMTCAGDEVMAAKSGYTLIGRSTPAQPIVPPVNLQVKNGINSGELVLTFDRVIGARSYVYEWTLDPLTEESVWSEAVGTRRTTVLTGLETGKRYWLRVAATGIKGQFVYSASILSLIVQ